MSEPTIWDIAMGGNPPEKFVPYADYVKLKAEVEHWQEQWHFVIQDNNKQMDEIAQLKAEVERLRKFNDEALAHIAKEERKSRECLDMAQAEVERLRNLGIKLDGYVDLLQGENERLRKAGDAMRWLIECQNDDAYYGHNEEHAEAVKAWKAAKEGNQP